MAKLRIPSETVEGFVALSSLDDRDFQKLVEIMAAFDANVIEDAGGLDEALGAQWPEASEQVHKAVWALSALHIGPVEAGESVEDFVQDLIETLYASPKTRPGRQPDEFRARLEPFLGMDGLRLALRIGNVMYDNERNFVQARILTDIRPVFATNQSRASEPLEIKQAVIVHYLKMTYTRSGAHEDFFVVLDDADVASLIETLERAQKKAESIDTFLTSKYHPSGETGL